MANYATLVPAVQHLAALMDAVSGRRAGTWHWHFVLAADTRSENSLGAWRALLRVVVAPVQGLVSTCSWTMALCCAVWDFCAATNGR